MYKFWKLNKTALSKLVRQIDQLFNRHQFLLIRRILAFLLDISILFAFCLTVAYGRFKTGSMILPSMAATIILPSYFLLSRLSPTGRSMGMKAFKLDFRFRAEGFRRVRLLCRFLLSIVFLLMPLDLQTLVEKLYPFDVGKFNFSLLTLGLFPSIPIYNFLMIIYSNGSASLIDQFSKCRIFIKTAPVEKEIAFSRGKFTRQHMGGFLLLTSLFCLIFSLLNWQYVFPKIFSDKTFAAAFSNPINMVGLSSEFMQFSKPGQQVFSIITKRGDYFIPYPVEQEHEMLEVFLYVPEQQFDNKEMHRRIVFQVEKARRLYNARFSKNIYQSRLVLYREGAFGPFIFTSEYKYIIAPGRDGTMIVVSDLPSKEKERILEKLYSNKLNERTIDSTVIDVKYEGFFVAKPDKHLKLQLSTLPMSSGIITFTLSPAGSFTRTEY